VNLFDSGTGFRVSGTG